MGPNPKESKDESFFSDTSAKFKARVLAPTLLNHFFNFLKSRNQLQTHQADSYLTQFMHLYSYVVEFNFLG